MTVYTRSDDESRARDISLGGARSGVARDAENTRICPSLAFILDALARACAMGTYILSYLLDELYSNVKRYIMYISVYIGEK